MAATKKNVVSKSRKVRPTDASSGPGVNRLLLQLSLPLAGTQLANIALSTTDTLVMGGLGTAALAGGGLAVIWFNQVRTMAVGLLTPLGNRIAHVHAQMDELERIKTGTSAARGELRNEIRNLTRTGVLLATLSGIIGAGVLVGIGYALPLFGQPQAVTDAALPMMWLLAPGLVPCLLFQVSRQFSVGLSKPQSLLAITLVMVVINAILDIAFVYGWGPVPRLGLAGVGLSTTAVHLVSAVFYYVLIYADDETRRFHAASFWNPDGGGFRETVAPHMRAQLRLGVPVALTYGAEAGMFSVLAMLMGSFGPAALAAHNVVYQITFIVFQIGVGFSHGSSILVSRGYGVNDLDLVRGAAGRALAFMAGVVSLAAVVFWVVPAPIIRPFMRDVPEETLSIAVSLLAIGALMEYVDTAQNLAIGALRGIGDTSTGLKASLIGYWVVGLPAACAFAFPFGLGAYGIWWGLIAGLTTTAFILWLAFWRKTSTHGGGTTEMKGSR